MIAAQNAYLFKYSGNIPLQVNRYRKSVAIRDNFERNIECIELRKQSAVGICHSHAAVKVVIASCSRHPNPTMPGQHRMLTHRAPDAHYVWPTSNSDDLSPCSPIVY